MGGMTTMKSSKVRVTITLRNHHHISFVISDDCKDLGSIVAELIRDINMTFDDILSVGYRVIKD